MTEVFSIQRTMLHIPSAELGLKQRILHRSFAARKWNNMMFAPDVSFALLSYRSKILRTTRPFSWSHHEHIEPLPSRSSVVSEKTLTNSDNHTTISGKFVPDNFTSNFWAASCQTCSPPQRRPSLCTTLHGPPWLANATLLKTRLAMNANRS